MEHTEFYEKCYGNVKAIENNLSQKNYMETENQIMKFETKRFKSRKDKNQLFSFLL